MSKTVSKQDAQDATRFVLFEAAQMLPKGWCIVPEEPTQEMLEAFIDKATKDDFGELAMGDPRAGYAAMLAASPNLR